MENVILPIPILVEGVVDVNIQELTYCRLNREHAIFLLGSLVYETANTKGERKFSRFAQNFPHFQSYLHFFLENNMLVKGREKEAYAYHEDIDWEKYLEPFKFDSIDVQKIIDREYPNFCKYLENAFEFLKPNITRTSPPF